ncbi:MAG: LamG-like jellyroll fold domain-containing protein [Phycisphaerales bacterium]
MYDRRVCALIALVFVLGSALTSVSDAALVGWWKFNDESGTVAKDSSGRGNDGAVTNPAWVEGKFGGALSFGGTSYVDVPAASWSTIRTQATVCFWAYGDPAQQPQANFIFGAFSDPANNDARRMSAHVPWSDGTIYFDTGGPSYNRINKAGSASDYEGAWTFWTFLKNADTGDQQIYINGVLWHSGTGMTQTMEGVTKFTIGTKPSLAEGWYRGMIDDFRLYDTALSIDEIQEAMTGRGPSLGLASDPVPEPESTDIPRDAVLSWTAGEYADTHDVYLGKTLADVNDAGRNETKDVLVSQGQAAATYAIATPLEYGQTYYWRVDEVNAAPDNTIYKGEVWSFTAEPFSYPIQNVTATASSQSRPDAGPQNTVNGSGLNAEDQHSVELTQMWLSTNAKPHWIQYEFDKVYKLDELWVWNANQIVEPFVGFGAKDVAIEYSTDGVAWTPLEGVPEFARATGAATYTANTIVEFGGQEARFVKLTINSNWGGVAQQTSLSEVRFFYVPVQAREPQPADAATDVALTASMSWRPGREAASHKVFFGADSNAVAAGTASAGTVTAHTYTPAPMAFGAKYFWKVDEIGDAGTYAGDVWSFTTLEFASLDDFEAYTDDEGSRIYEAWVDGVTDPANGGSTDGYMQAPFAEKTIVHAGKQAMPLAYDNTKAPFFSEASQEFDTPQNCTGSGASELCVWTRGYPAVTTTAVTETGGKMSLTGSRADIWNNSDEFTYAYKTLAGDGALIARVTSIGPGTNTWAKGGVMIRDSLNGGSTHAMMVMSANTDGAAGNGASFQYRSALNGTSGNSDSSTVIKAPYWVKIERAGDTFTGYTSADGKTWLQMGTTVITMADPVLIGVCVTSHVVAEERTFQFEGIAATGNVTGAWQGAVINAAQYNDAAPMYLTVTDSAGKSATATSDTAATAANWTRWAVPMNSFSGVSFSKIKKITIGVGAKGATTGGAGMVFIDDIGYGRSAQ